MPSTVHTVQGLLGQREQSGGQAVKGLAEALFLQNASSRYVHQGFQRSCIAVAFNPAGTLLASTHGDHTVKVVDVASAQLVAQLVGHRRTPWTVAWHPHNPDVLATGSLDHAVIVWSVGAAQRLAHLNTGYPIAALCFTACGDMLAVQAGRKMLMWPWQQPLPAGALPPVVLKTSRAQRAVLVQPTGRPLVVAADVQDKLAEAAASKFPPALTSQPGDVWLLASAGPPAPPGGGLQARPNVRDSSAGSGASGSISSGLQRLQLQALDGEAAASSSGMLPPGGAAGGGGGEGVQPAGRAAAPPEPPPVPAALASQPLPRLGQPDIWSPLMELGTRLAELLRSGGDPALPQQQALLGAAEAAGGAAAAPGGAAPAPCSAAAGYLCGWAADCSGLDAQVHGVAFDAQQLQQLLAGDAPSAAGEATVQATEVPCLVRLRAWPCAAAAPQLPLQRAAAALELHGVVLCSALGVSVSPCGRRLACCLATRAPALGGGDGGAGQATAPAPAGGAGSTGQQQGPNGTPQQQPGPQQLPEPPPPLLFELRVLSLLPGEEGQVLGARALSAPHCLTSVQFSPAGGHILLAFGRRHASLAGFVMAGAGSRAASMTAVQRVVEVYRADTLQLVRALCSAADEINAAAWHPTPGWGFAYGTKDGRVRLVASGQDPWAGRVPSVAAGPDPWAGWARAVAARGAAAGVAQGAAGAGAAEEGAVGGVAGAMAVGLAAEAEAEAEAEAGLQAAAAGAAEAGAVGPAPSAPPDTAASAAEQPTVGSESEGSAYIGAGVAGELGMRAAVQRTQFGATHD